MPQTERSVVRGRSRACLVVLKRKTNHQDIEEKNHVPLLAKITPPGSAPRRRKRAVRHCEVSCGVPQYRQPQPGAQANQRWAW